LTPSPEGEVLSISGGIVAAKGKTRTPCPSGLGYDTLTFSPRSAEEERIMIIAELAVFPTSEGSSISRYVREAVRAVEALDAVLTRRLDS
jgi:hypothetical protein